jgi:hypothetical protein
LKLEEVEQAAKRYAGLRHGNDAEISKLAAKVVDSISSPDFAFPLKEETQSSSGTTSYVYKDNATYPALFDFLAELLHMTVPIEIDGAKFGPGEIIVSKQDKAEADKELGRCVKELQELVHAKKSEILSKHGDTA